MHHQGQQVALHGFWHLSPEVWTAIATLALVAVGLVAGGVALWQVFEARRLRREQAQPYVAVFAESSGNHPAQIDLVIKNFGATPAREIRVKFTPEPQSANLRASGVTRGIRVPEVISLLVPGQEWRTYWDWGAALEEAKDLPRKYDVRVSFKDLRGKRVRPDSEFVIDWEVVFAQAPINVNSFHDAAGAIMDIRTAIQSVLTGRKAVPVESFDGERQRKRRSRNERRRLDAGESPEIRRTIQQVLIAFLCWAERLSRQIKHRFGHTHA
jgi:hypothetical protein